MISEKNKNCKDILKSAGLRQTRARLEVLAVLCRANEPITHEQIQKKLGVHAPNKVTIYRVLDRFSDNGLVHKAFLRDRKWHFELKDNCSQKQCHPHFICTECGRAECMAEISIPMTKCSRKGLVINYQNVQLEGLCQRCSLKQNK